VKAIVWITLSSANKMDQSPDTGTWPIVSDV